MKRFFLFTGLIVSIQLIAQDSTMNNLTKEMDANSAEQKLPVKIFNSTRTINANTTQTIGKGKMDFKVTHNFGDIAGNDGGIKNFFGLDNTFDVRIGFDIGLTDRLSLGVSRGKGDELHLRGDSAIGKRDNLLSKLFEISLKYQLLRQFENDPAHPISIAVFVNSVVSTRSKTSVPNLPNSFDGLGDRMSRVVQLIIAKKIGKVSLQLSPTLVNYGYTPTYDENNTFALGAAMRVPFSRTLALIVDYFHSFHSDIKKQNYKTLQGVKFYDPLGVGLEITTAGHIFHLNFTNSTGILENQFIPYTTSSWGKGQFRWGFNISRTFVLWREKK
jgi:hypothetical protein